MPLKTLLEKSWSTQQFGPGETWDISPIGFFMHLETAPYILKEMSKLSLVYHNFAHALDLAEEAQELFSPAEKPWSFEDMLFYYLAAFYHDAVYIPGAKNNEEESAKLFLQDVLLLFPKPFYERYASVIGEITLCIRLSANHFAPQAYTENDRINNFLDLDLLGLASSPEQFDINSAKIKLENKANDEIWVVGRSKWLETIIGKKIFRNQPQEIEDRAQANIRWEYKNLQFWVQNQHEL